MGIFRKVMMICVMILDLLGTTTMASKPFSFDERPNEVCCHSDFPCSTVPLPPGPDGKDDNVVKVVVAPSPMAPGQ